MSAFDPLPTLQSPFVNPAERFASPDSRAIENVHPLRPASRLCSMMDMQTNIAETGSNESHVDRAMRGPTPDNPSLSLKKRLQRAAFFDKREREVAAGKAEPVEADAGLPEAMTEDA